MANTNTQTISSAKRYSGEILQACISECWETMDSELQNMRGIMILRRAAQHLDMLNEGVL